MIFYTQKWIDEIKSGKRSRYGWLGKDRLKELEQDLAKYKKGADGTSRTSWRFDSARNDGSGKLDGYDETGAKPRNNRALKRRASKDTRRYGKLNTRKELDDL
jgi:hypothetical protein